MILVPLWPGPVRNMVNVGNLLLVPYNLNGSPKMLDSFYIHLFVKRMYHGLLTALDRNDRAGPRPGARRPRDTRAPWPQQPGTVSIWASPSGCAKGREHGRDPPGPDPLHTKLHGHLGQVARKRAAVTYTAPREAVAVPAPPGHAPRPASRPSHRSAPAALRRLPRSDFCF